MPAPIRRSCSPHGRRRTATRRRTGSRAIANITIADEADRSVVYIVTDDMPFLVDSVNAELVRQKAPIHLVMHPLFVVTRNRESGELVKVARVPSHLGISSGDTAAMPNLSHLIAQGDNASHMESWIAVEIDRVDDAKRAALVEGIGPGARRRAGRRRRLAEDAAQGTADRRGPRQAGQPCADRRTPPGPGTAPLAGRRELHLPRLPRVRPQERIRRGRPGTPGGERPRAAARRSRHPAPDPAPHRGRPEEGPRKARAGHHQGQLPLHRPPLRVPGLHRRQELRRRRQRQRRTPLHRALRHHRVRRIRPRHSGGPRKSRRRPERRGLPARLPLRQGPAGHPRDLPARRTLPDRNP